MANAGPKEDRHDATNTWRLLRRALSSAAVSWPRPPATSTRAREAIVLQIAIAFLVGVAFSVKVFWKKISAFLRKTSSAKRKNGPDAHLRTSSRPPSATPPAAFSGATASSTGASAIRPASLRHAHVLRAL